MSALFHLPFSLVFKALISVVLTLPSFISAILLNFNPRGYIFVLYASIISQSCAPLLLPFHACVPSVL